MNSRAKGKRGERQWRDELRAHGYDARRGQQFAGSPESPDVVCPALRWIHFEVKAVERLNIEDAMDQARADARVRSAECRVQNGEQKIPIVAHRRNFRPWLVTMEATAFFRLLKGDVPAKERVEGCELRVESGKAGRTEGNGDNEEKNFGGGALGERALPEAETRTKEKELASYENAEQ